MKVSLLLKEILLFGISGVLFVLFLIFHLTVNLTSVISRRVYEATWQNIKESLFVQIIIPVFVVGIVLHILFAVILCFREWKTVSRERKADGYEKAKGNVLKTVLSLSSILIGLSVIHLGQFWAKVQLRDESPYDIAKTLFYNGFYVAVYAVWIIALYYYLSHGYRGLYRSMQTGRIKQSSLLQTVSIVLAFLIASGFIFIPVYFYLGFGYLQ
jgi:succinate dehydrogenase / fumarate reductase cytochrome b subunit